MSVPPLSRTAIRGYGAAIFGTLLLKSRHVLGDIYILSILLSQMDVAPPVDGAGL